MNEIKQTIEKSSSQIAAKEYNEIAKGYEKATQRPLRKFTYEPTFLKFLPPLRNKKVLDLACGEGISSRLLLRHGAKEVVGVDVSSELIKKAKELNTPNAKYFVEDAINGDFRKYGKFDLVIAAMLLHYSKTEEEIDKMVKNVKSVLSPGGTFYTMTVNPIFCKNGYSKYGIKLVPESHREGSHITVQLHDFDWNKFCEFSMYHWSKKTYDKIFQKNGFVTTWHKGIVSPEGIEEYGQGFWQDFLDEPVYVVVEGRLKLGSN